MQFTAFDNSTEEQVLQEGYIKRVFPNPANPAVAVQFVLPKAMEIGLKVFNMRGQLIHELLAQKQEGLNELVWLGTDQAGRQVATGIYSLQLRMGTVVATERITLLK